MGDEIKSQVNEKFKKLIKEEDNKLKLYDNDDIFFWYLVNSEAISYEDKKKEFVKRRKLKKKKISKIDECIKKKSEIAAEKHEKLKNMLINKPLKNDRDLTNKI